MDLSLAEVGAESRLLRRYAARQDDAAFDAIVRQYAPMVYAAARRRIGDATLAEDVTQAVFMILTTKAKSVPKDLPLSGWLLKTVKYCSANAIKIEPRRRKREGIAAAMNASGTCS